MLRVMLSRSLNFQFGAFTVLVVLIHSCRGQRHVIGPSQPIVATVGEDVVLPAYLRPATNALRETVEWTRPDLSPRFVHVLRQGVKLTGNHPSYEGRTSLFTDELKLGNISLKLSRVRISDEGLYRCFIPELDEEYTVQLVVGAASSPVVQKTRNSSRVVLQCESTGWYPEPEVFWLDGEGNLLSAGPTETVRGPDDLYTVSSRVTVEKRHSNSFTCRVQQNSTKQTRETLIHVPDDFFAGPSGSSSSLPVIIGVIFIILVVLAAAAVVVWKWRQNKIRKKKQREDEEGGNSPELKHLMGGETDGKQPTEETETVNNVDEFRGEPGQTETDEETLQREANNAQCADSEGTELQFTEEAGGRTTRETETGLDQSQEETKTEAVSEADSLNPVSTDLNNTQTKTVTMVEQRQEDNNQQTADETEGQSLTEEDKHGEQQTAETGTPNVLQNNKATPLQTQTDAKTPQTEPNKEEGPRDRALAEGKTKIEPDKARDDPDPAKNDLNNEEDENNTTSDNAEKLKEEQTENKQQTADETEGQSLTEEDKHGEQQTAERETLRDREKENLEKKLKTKEREVKKFEDQLTRYEEQMKDKEKQINEVKQQLEEMERQTEETERKLRSVKKEDKDYKRLSVLNRKEEELQEQLKKIETQLERIKKDEINTRQKKLKATNEKEEMIMKLKELEMQNHQSDPVDSLTAGLKSVPLN